MEHEPILTLLTYTDYRPGMKIYLHDDSNELKKGDIVEIKEVNGYDPVTNSFKQPHGKGALFFIVSGDKKIVWNEAGVSCCIPRDQTTDFLDGMAKHYEHEAERCLNDVERYSWTQHDHDRFLREKLSVVEDMLLQYEYKRLQYSFNHI